jgi:TolB-like protein/Tfp pilus assembly protein PilF
MASSSSPTSIVFPPFRLDLRAGQLLRDRTPVHLRPKTFAVLCYLAERPGELVTKDALLDAVWNDVVVSQDVVRISAGELRAALDDDWTSPRFIETVHRRGYRFVAALENDRRPELGASGNAATADGILVGYAPALPDRPSIVVLPFTNMSGEAEQDYFADGMVEDVVTALSRFKELFVIARNSAFVYKGCPVDVQQVGRELGVRYVLEGSVRKAGSRVRITGQLIDVATRSHLWAERFDGTVADVFELQDRITESVVAALVPTLRKAEIERARRKPPASLDAYDYVLRAIPLVFANTVAESEPKVAPFAGDALAVQLLEEALRLQPDYPHAHALIAYVYGQVYRSAIGPAREEARTRASAHAREAVRLGADDGAVLAYAGFILLIADKDVGGARVVLDRAVARNPNSATAFTYRALVLAVTGESGPAIEDARHALRLSPLDPHSYLPLMAMLLAHLWRREYDEAVAAGHEAIELVPRYPMSYAWLVVAECERGDIAEAERQMKRLAAVLPGFTPVTLAKLFEIFPEPLASRCRAVLLSAGLIPADAA